MNANTYQVARPRKTSLAIVVLLHGAAITALALSKMEIISIKRPRTEIFDVTLPRPPEPVEFEKVKPEKPAEVRKIVPIIATGQEVQTLELPPDENLVPQARIEPERIEPVPPPEPVRLEAQIDSNSELQPPYPPSEQRIGAEGSVALRVLIGSDGRVKSAEKVRATSEAFYQTTLRHALRSWRFKPATVDGRPVESSKLMTVRFRIES